VDAPPDTPGLMGNPDDPDALPTSFYSCADCSGGSGAGGAPIAAAFVIILRSRRRRAPTRRDRS
jgi:hypothetical protein